MYAFFAQCNSLRFICVLGCIHTHHPFDCWVVFHRVGAPGFLYRTIHHWRTSLLFLAWGDQGEKVVQERLEKEPSHPPSPPPKYIINYYAAALENEPVMNHLHFPCWWTDLTCFGGCRVVNHMALLHFGGWSFSNWHSSSPGLTHPFAGGPPAHILTSSLTCWSEGLSEAPRPWAQPEWTGLIVSAVLGLLTPCPDFKQRLCQTLT